ncbi:multicopper oxidase domain-containing protein [Paenibacillus sp. MMS18-CY102]|nr:multicopper oxidase domain-containing protein [Paenibacillus sp. MMS18-CY102]
MLSAARAPVFWVDRLALQVPLAVLPTAMLGFVTVPRLRKLRLKAKGLDGALPYEVRAEAAHPGIVLPFHASALGALTAFYYAMEPPVPFRFIDAIMPLLAYGGVLGLLYVRHLHRWRKVSVLAAPLRYHAWGRFGRFAGTVAAVGAIAAVGIAIEQQSSKLPARMSMMAGEMDWGGGQQPIGTEIVHAHSEHGGHIAATEAAAVGSVEVTAAALRVGEGASTAAGMRKHDVRHVGGVGTVSLDQLTGPQDGKPDRTFTLVAQRQDVRLASGEVIKDAWAFNGELPGPELRMKKGELIEVKLVNQNVDEGVTLHWHGLDVPNAEDGVAGVTQNAVMPGQSYTYRFVAEQTGTYWYHSHQDSQEAVSRGLFGPLVVEPASEEGAVPLNTGGGQEAHAELGEPPEAKEFTAMTHIWDRVGLAVDGWTGVRKETVVPGTEVRLRLINTDDWVRQSYSVIGTSFRVVAIDGTDVNEPGLLAATRLELTTGGRYDLSFTMPNQPVFLAIGNGTKTGLLMTPDGKGEAPSELPSSEDVFIPTHYGKPTATAFGADSIFDRQFTMLLDNKLGFYNGAFNQLYTINGKVFPDTPMFMVQEGDLVHTTIINRSIVDHPMHLHGHHMLVLSRNGDNVDGSPWWSDTLDVQPGETYELAFRADNPGLWMDHCHNLEHAAAGMSMHLMYEGITSPYEVGSGTVNHPE